MNCEEILILLLGFFIWVVVFNLVERLFLIFRMKVKCWIFIGIIVIVVGIFGLYGFKLIDLVYKIVSL